MTGCPSCPVLLAVRVGAAAALASLAAGCSGARLFAPRENQNGFGPTGQPAAVYALAVVTTAGEEHARGEVRLWSDGAHATDSNGDDRTTLHAGFELENTGRAPLSLDLSSLTADLQLAGAGAGAGDGEPVRGLRPLRTAGAAEAGPGTQSRLDVWFEPRRADGTLAAPSDVRAFDLRWSIRAGDTVVLQQVTPFAPYVLEPSPWYDPWYDPWHSWHFGLGWHRCD